MSFPKAPLKRFNETAKEAGTQQNPCSMKPVPSPATARKLKSLGSKPNSGVKSEKDSKLMKDLKRQKELEKEIRVLVGERGQQDKRLQALEDDLTKSESKLSAAIREKTSLLANVASLEKQLLELTRTNELLKTKFSEDGTQKKMSSLCLELMKLRNLMNSKKMTHVRREDTEPKLQTTQRTVEHSKEKAAQLEELTATEILSEEKCDSEKLLEYIAELGNAAEQVDKYKLEISQLEGIIAAKDKEIETLRSSLQLKEAMLSAQINEFREKCKVIEQQREALLIEHGEREQSMKAEIGSLKEKFHLEEQEHQKQKQVCQELSATMHQKLLKFQEEVAKEKELLERELRATMAELEELHTNEEKVEKLLKHLEQENKLQAEELVQLEAKLKGKTKELDEMAESHSNAIVQMQEEYSHTLRKLGETVAEFETYKACVAEDIACHREENTTLKDKLLEMNKAVQHTTQLMQEVQHAKDKAKEEYARMLLDAQTKLALKDAEIKRTKESSFAQIANLQARLEEQSEDLKKRLEIERKAISEKVKANYEENMKSWRVLYEELYNKVKPFQEQLDAYEAEKNALLNQHGAAQEELNQLSDAYAKLLGHQNQKQKIKHVVKLKEENAQLKQELTRLRTQLGREKQFRGELQDQLNVIQGVKRFDPSKAFQHSIKENVTPQTPFKESNRNKSQTTPY
ncbi:hyaluronan mediated motility receptor isoform X2 [Hemicordylus capensis]|uniref:hyaluronan mediated motility receptor isoform X2 n=1 Tax=Hemicordylus capensis TaxID=884348 RepID=UPI00230493DE|nr:hyaluronan mediated motility receptor isoform X2 [Hemicordylus capensis]